MSSCCRETGRNNGREEQPRCFQGAFREETELPSVAPLRLNHVRRRGAGAPPKAMQWAPCNPSKGEEQHGSPSLFTLTHSRSCETGPVCGITEREIRCAADSFFNLHTFHWSKDKEGPSLKRLTLGCNWRPRGGQQFACTPAWGDS